MTVVWVTQLKEIASNGKMPRQDGGGLLPHETVSDGAESPVISRKADFSHPIKVRRRACTLNEACKSLQRAGAPNRDQVVSGKYNSRFRPWLTKIKTPGGGSRR
jgi:hypothetical protein